MLPILVSLCLGATPLAPLACPAATADRGTVRSGPPLVHTFRLSHAATDGTVSITGVETGCGCVRRDLSVEILQPGDHADLTLTINTLTQPAGPNAWRAVVRYRFTPAAGSPADHRLELTVRADLIREVTVTPPELAFSTAGTAAQTLTVADRRPKPLTVTRVAASAPFLNVEVRPAASRDIIREQPVIVTASASAPAGEWSEVVTLLTDDPTCPELRVPVRVTKRTAAAATASPASVDIRFSPGQSELSRVVQIRAGGKPVAIREAVSDNPAVTVTHSSAGPVAAVRIKVASDKPGTAAVRVSLDEPAGVEVTIPVAWQQP